MEFDVNRLRIVNNEAEQRFETEAAGHLAVIEYIRAGGRITFTHTRVPRAIEGRGIASKMAQTVLEYAKKEDLTVIPQCPFVAAYIRRHPEYQFLVL
jgi:predicted GNAT family acetyltransferase